MCAAPGSKTSQIEYGCRTGEVSLPMILLLDGCEFFVGTKKDLVFESTLTNRNGFDLPLAWGPFDKILLTFHARVRATSKFGALTRKEEGFQEKLF